jgi:hypothetical protein
MTRTPSNRLARRPGTGFESLAAHPFWPAETPVAASKAVERLLVPRIGRPYPVVDGALVTQGDWSLVLRSGSAKPALRADRRLSFAFRSPV